jgi:L-threonylcarbamoyladenylate synthase
MSFEIELNKTDKVLREKGIILYPTDTVWGIGCDASDERAVKKIFKIKKRDESKSLVILVDTMEMLQGIVPIIPKTAIDLIESTTKPITIIYNNPIGLAKNVVAEDNTVAIRIVQDEFCQRLIHRFKKPIVSTSANIHKSPTPKQFSDIQAEILRNVDYIVDLYPNKISSKSSQIVKITADGSLEILRE